VPRPPPATAEATHSPLPPFKVARINIQAAATTIIALHIKINCNELKEETAEEQQHNSGQCENRCGSSSTERAQQQHQKQQQQQQLQQQHHLVVAFG